MKLIDFFKDLFGIDDTAPPDPADPCNASACVDAKHKLAAARKGFNTACLGLKILRQVEDLLRPLISIPLWIVIASVILIALLTALGGLFQVAAIILLGLLILYGIAWFLRFVIGELGVAAVASLAKHRKEFEEALMEVILHCPERCLACTRFG